MKYLLRWYPQLTRIRSLPEKKAQHVVLKGNILEGFKK